MVMFKIDDIDYSSENSEDDPDWTPPLNIIEIQEEFNNFFIYLYYNAVALRRRNEYEGQNEESSGWEKRWKSKKRWKIWGRQNGVFYDQRWKEGFIQTKEKII